MIIDKIKETEPVEWLIIILTIILVYFVATLLHEGGRDYTEDCEKIIKIYPDSKAVKILEVAKLDNYVSLSEYNRFLKYIEAEIMLKEYE